MKQEVPIYPSLRNYAERPGKIVARPQLFNWLKKKYKQLQTLVSDKELTLALISPFSEPVEGARFQVGDRLHARSHSGECRQFQVCGVKSGGFSNVYTVIDINEMRAYGLKGIRTLPKDEKDQIRKLENEANIWLQIGRHENIATAHAVLSIYDEPYILIEYVAGEDLNFLNRSGLVDKSSALKYCLQLCRAMIHAQATCPGIVHGDIKPANCLVTQDGNLKLVDFGMAFSTTAGHAESSQSDSSFQSVDKRGGTYAYMAPEKFNPDLPITAQTDIYAFGITLFELLVGERPFKGPGKDDFRGQHIKHMPPIEILRENEISVEIVALIEKCLRKSPSERIPDFIELENVVDQAYTRQTKEKFPLAATDPQVVADIVLRGDSYSLLGDFERARKCFEQAIEIEPSNANTWAQRAILFIADDQFDMANTFSDKAVSLDPGSLTASISRGLAFEAVGQLNQSLEQFERALKIEPGDARTLNLLGEILFRIGRSREAAKCFKRSHKKDAFHVEPLCNLARVDFSNGKLKRALRVVEQAISINDKSAESWKIRGDCLASLKFFGDSIESYKISMDLGMDADSVRKPFVAACCEFYGSSGRPVNRELASVLYRSVDISTSIKSGFVDDAIKVLQKEQYDPLVLYFLNDALFGSARQAGRRKIEELAIKLWNVFDASAGRTFPINPYYSIGKMFYQMDKFDDCLKIFKHSLKTCGSDEKSFYYIAACYEVLEEFKLSRSYYDKALKIDPSCESNRTGRRRVEAKLLESTKERAGKEESI